MVKSPIKVFVRTRPATVPSKNLLINEKERWINLNVPKKETRGHINHQIENWGFRFDGILTDSSQENVFDRIARDTVTSALEGYSGTIFCYGQTGAGKTFTMSGSTSSYKQRGIIPRTISALFQEIKLRAMERVEVKVSYLEIYNEVMLDLLTTSQENITINEDRRGGVVLKGLSQITCEREDEGLNLFFEGEINKSTSQHNCNKSSSRAHSIFTLYIKSKAKVGMNERTVYSKINLVDLAGSERTKKTGSEGQTLIEANYINKSLSFLQQVVCALSEKQREHVPYRQSKLTNLLKDSIGGNCKTIMIANIWPEASNLEETISTLKFATSIKKVSNEAIANVFVNPLSPPRGYDVSGRNSAVSLDQTDYKPLTREEKEEQHIIAKKFLNGKLEDIEIKSIGQVKELFNQFKGMYQNLVDATKGYFHLLPENKLEELGIEADMYPRGQYCIRETVEGNDEVRSRKKRSKVVSMDNSFSHEQEEQEQSFNGEQRQGRAHTRLMDCLRVEEHDEDEGLDKKLLKGLAGMIRQRSQAKRETEQKIRAMQSKTVSYQVDQEQNLEEEDVFEKDMHTEHDYTQDIKEIKERFKEHTEKINELKSTILSADQNIKRSRSLVVEKIEEILHPNQLYAQSSVKSKFQGNMMPNFGYMSTRNSDAPRNLY